VRRAASWVGADFALLLPLAGLAFIFFLCFLLPLLVTLPSSSLSNLSAVNLPVFSPGHLLGTDALGNDLFARSLYGGRVSIEVGLGAMACGLFLGGIIGVFAGFVRSSIDSLIMRGLDVFLAFPSLILALCVSNFLGPNERDEIIAIAFFTVPFYARIARASTLRIRDREYVLAGKVMGSDVIQSIRRHIYPNVFPSLITIAPITVSVAMVVESGLSFLGAGVRPPIPSWGNMIAAGQPYLGSSPNEVLVPGIFLFVSVFLLNLLGERLRVRLSGGSRST
jgi:peptide/nickel transport system permease protein